MQIVVQAGAQSGQVFQLRDSLIIGRGSGNDIVFSDPAMSRVHCEIRREGDGYVIEDRHSANGTFVNNEQIELPFLLRPGDIIRMGQTVLVFQDECADKPASGLVSDQANETPWRLIAGVVGIFVLVIAIALYLSSRSAESNIAIAPTRTVAVVAKATATVVPTETATTAPSPTFTAVPETPTALPPTATVTISPSQARSYPYPVLSVVLPEPQKKFGASSPIPFNWIAVDSLTSDEQYRVQISTSSDFAQIACEIRTRATYVTIPGEGVTCTNQWQFGQHYYWRVHIIPRDAFYSDTVAATDAAPVNEFSWGQ